MSTRYEQQIEKLVAYVRKINQTVEERNQQLHYWQGYARKLRDERQRLGQSMLGQVRRVLADVAARYRDASTEVTRLRHYVESLRALHQRREINLRNQLDYAMARIDDLSLERRQVRDELTALRRQAQPAPQAADPAGAAELVALKDEAQKLRSENRRLAGELDAIHQQGAIQERQWQDLMQRYETTIARLAQTEEALDKARHGLGEVLANQTISTAREVDDLRSLVISLQHQTADLREQLADSQDAMDQQERFIALLKPGMKPQVRPLRKEDPPATEEGPGNQADAQA
ncbi:MAG: hypothetical protein FJY99_09260 [Candidatus Sericytochromatia bacterium]|nr:hypothetical protein [Candidatus Tanganyikabacteria bacterium]